MFGSRLTRSFVSDMTKCASSTSSYPSQSVSPPRAVGGRGESVGRTMNSWPTNESIGIADEFFTAGPCSTSWRWPLISFWPFGMIQ